MTAGAVVRSLADRTGVLFQGTLCEVGEVGEVFEPPFHPYTHELLMAVPSAHRRTRHTAPTRDRQAVASPSSACVFAGRCPWQVGQICEQVPPPWRESGKSLRIRCHLPLDELADRAVWRPTATAATNIASQ